MVARYGGEEFAIVISNIPTDKSMDLTNEKAEILRQEVEKKTEITISIGTTVINKSDQNVDVIYERVDKNLYLAKNAGRNLVCSDNGLINKQI